MRRKPKFSIRKATKGDAHDLWLWRNDGLARAHSLNSKRISFEQHQRWFLKSLRHHGRKIYIASQNGRNIGMVRLDFPDEKIVEISINLNPSYRGRGFGKKILKTMSGWATKIFKHRIQKAIIKTSNPASEKVFASAGFVKIHQVATLGYSVWIRN